MPPSDQPRALLVLGQLANPELLEQRSQVALDRVVVAHENRVANAPHRWIPSRDTGVVQGRDNPRRIGAGAVCGAGGEAQVACLVA